MGASQELIQAFEVSIRLDSSDRSVFRLLNLWLVWRHGKWVELTSFDHLFKWRICQFQGVRHLWLIVDKMNFIFRDLSKGKLAISMTLQIDG
jgi:hypothetical protein